MPANISLKDFTSMLPRTIRKKCNYFGHVKSSIFLRSEEKFLRPIQAIFHQHEWSNVSLFNSSHLCIASTYTYSQLRFYENCWHIFGHTCPEIERSPALPKSTVQKTCWVIVSCRYRSHVRDRCLQLTINSTRKFCTCFHFFASWHVFPISLFNHSRIL